MGSEARPVSASRRHIAARSILAILTLALCAGCYWTTRSRRGAVGDSVKPRWAAKGSGVFSTDKGEMIYGVGAAPPGDGERWDQFDRAVASARSEVVDQVRRFWRKEIEKLRLPDSNEASRFVKAVPDAATVDLVKGMGVRESWRSPDTQWLNVLITVPLHEALAQSKPAIMKKAAELAPRVFGSHADERLKSMDQRFDWLIEEKRMMARIQSQSS